MHEFETNWISLTAKNNLLASDFISNELASVRKISVDEINQFCVHKLEF